MRVVSTSTSCRQIVLYRYRYADAVSPEKLATLAETSLNTIQTLTACGVLQPLSDGDKATYQVRDVRTVRQAVRLHRDLDVSWVSMPVVLDLLDRVDTLESQLRALRRRTHTRRLRRATPIRERP